ncbi:MAG TPA: thiamine pyrophosphate-dependent enzyme [Candidatus Angelobacter sp.]|nr:thiamine pyrophosphate-dependent enzyme [Candidatus Angelobacter sp.]
MPSRKRENSPQKKAGAPGTAGLHSSPPKSETSALLNSEKLKLLYAAMLKTRMSREKLSRSTSRRGMISSAPEALEVGAALNLAPRDNIAPGPHETALRWISGALAEGKQVAEHVCPGTSCARIGVATGIAFASKTSRRRVTVVVTTQLDVTHDGWKEALRFAAESKLAIVYLIESDARKPNDQLFRTAAQKCGLPAITVDGDDVVAVYRVMQECMRRARQGHGPALIECRTGLKDPLRFMQDYLAKRNLWTEKWEQEIARRAAKEVRKLRVLM